MHNPPTTPAGSGPWRLLILDSSPDDPLWMIATITLPTDVRAAAIDRPSGVTTTQKEEAAADRDDRRDYYVLLSMEAENSGGAAVIANRPGSWEAAIACSTCVMG
jgi:hypothetical protein